jgi:phosphopantothenoylcysteine decarboxylase/phosphopantothenate--cysteine ligase
MPKIILGVSGGVSAYKAISLARLLIDSGHEVHVVPTPSALNFVGKATWEAITGKPVYSEVFEATDKVAHVELARQADLIVVVPATADLLYRASAGAANDMLSAILLTASCPVIYFPAMHSEMWLNSATQENVQTLRSRNSLVINPATGALARGDEGIGRLPEPEQILNLINSFLVRNKIEHDFSELNVLVTLGGTLEKIDPVRYISNSSTGEMGAAICRAFYLRGANVSAIVANHTAVIPHDIDVVSVSSAKEMLTSATEIAKDSDIIVMSAAISDFTVEKSTEKIKRGREFSLNLIPTEDVLNKISAQKSKNQIIVGFAAQTGDVISNGQEKFHQKGCDLLVANEVGDSSGFGKVRTRIHLISKDQVSSSAEVSKDEAAHIILDSIKALISQSQ